MKKNILLFLILNLVALSGSAETSKSENCFSASNFVKVKSYIDWRISVSSTGEKFYLKYPIRKTFKSGLMRYPKNPENVFNIIDDKQLKEIIFENKEAKFKFNYLKGFIPENNQEPKSSEIANNIFCHLVGKANEELKEESAFISANCNELYFDQAFKYIQWKFKTAKKLSNNHKVLFRDNYELEALEDGNEQKIVFSKQGYKYFSVYKNKGLIPHTISKQGSAKYHKLFCELAEQAL